MLNKSGVTKTTLTAPKQILANVELQSSVGCIVPQTLGVEVAGSKKRESLRNSNLEKEIVGFGSVDILIRI